MKEEEYIVAQDLTRLRIIREIFREIISPVIPEDGYKLVRKQLDAWIAEHFEALEVYEIKDKE